MRPAGPGLPGRAGSGGSAPSGGVRSRGLASAGLLSSAGDPAASRPVHGRVTTAEQILRFLSAVRARLYRRSAVVAGALTLAAPLVASAATAAAARNVALWTLGLAAVGLAGGVWAGWFMPRRAWRDDRQVARWVGRRQRPLASDLLSAVELEAGDGSRARFSPTLIAHLMEQVSGQVEEIEPETLMPAQPLRRARRAVAAVAVLWLAAALFTPARLARGWDRMLHAPPPGPFGGASVVEGPLVGDIHLTLHFPAYTGRPVAEIPSSAGDFRAMPGTVVEFRTTALVPTRTARIVFGDDEGDDAVVMTAAGDELIAELTVGDAVDYRFLIDDPDGGRHVERRPHRIEIDADQAPKVELYAPADELDVTSMKRIELAWVAEDDYGLTKAELVIESPGVPTQRRPVPTAAELRRSAQGRFVWDLAEITIEPGTLVAYHLEVSDNDTVSGPNVGRSRDYHLRVFSARERHEALIDRQAALFEHLLALLAERLVVAVDAVDAHDLLQKATGKAVVELGSLIAALGEDRMATPKLVQTLTAMRQRLDGLGRAEARLLAQLHRSGGRPGNRLAGSDRAQVSELEDDSALLADWIDRQRLEVLLAISDEIDGHKERLRELFKELARTGSPAVRKEIERELRALARLLAEQASKRGTLAADVLDQFINRDALDADKVSSCTDEVSRLLDAGDVDGAQKKMEECAGQLDQATGALEGSLEALRGDRFSDEERKYDELMNELADLAHDQGDIAGRADDIWERYARRADDLMRDTAKQTRERVSDQIERLEKLLSRVPGDGLTQFSEEELDLVKKRIGDVRAMLADGDIAEALAMARQADGDLDNIEAELEATLEEEDDSSPWVRRTREAQRAVKRARPAARKLIDELEQALPAPDDIMSAADRRELDRLRRSQQAVRERTRRLAKKVDQAGTDLPGTAGEEMRRGLDEAGEPMDRASQRMRARDPAGARHNARDAADRLEQSRKQAQSAARQQQRSGRSLRDEPVRIPGADEYRPPEEFREELLEAMKKELAPDGYSDMVKRYYEELIK